MVEHPALCSSLRVLGLPEGMVGATDNLSLDGQLMKSRSCNCRLLSPVVKTC